MKQKLKQKILQVLLWKYRILIFLLLIGINFTLICGVIIYQKVEAFIADPLKQQIITGVFIPRAQAELSIPDYVKQEIIKAGLSNEWELVNCLIDNESKWNEWAVNWNTNGSIDYGLWQINSCHKNTISVKDRFDYKTATEWAIAKRLRDGNWEAWSALSKCR